MISDDKYNSYNYDNNGDSKRNFKKRTYDKDDIIKKRNKRLLEFFKLCGLSVRLIGDENSPAMVYDNKYILNAYVHNFELRFTDSPFQGNVVYLVKLTAKPNFDRNKIISCIDDYQKREVYKIRVKDSTPQLFLSGYNFLNKDEKLGRYPVFSAYYPKVYFSEEKATEISNELNQDGYKVEVISQ